LLSQKMMQLNVWAVPYVFFFSWGSMHKCCEELGELWIFR
jgi:hypothetical protein